VVPGQKVRRIAAITDLFGASRTARIQLIDAARGVAIIAMVIYHVAWDLYYLGFVQTDVIDDPVWEMFQRSIVVTFLLLVGIGLVLGHGEGIRWRSFWRRFAVILGAAVLTTIGTYIAFPEYFVYFGILHAIAMFSLLGLAFVGAPPWLLAIAALVVLLPPALITSPVMTEKPLSWIGFWPTPPMTTDIVPVFPWFGVVLLGIFGMRLLVKSASWPRLAAIELGAPGRVLAVMGRWSLVIYLVHQPVIYETLNWLSGMRG